MSGSPEISIVIPLYNEGSHLSKTLTVLSDELNLMDSTYEIILVDDGSHDNTWSIIESVIKHYPSMRAIQLSRNFGKESALCAGLDVACGNAIVVMDGDLQHPPSLIPHMKRIWIESKVDIVEAVKKDRGSEPLLQKYGALIFYFLIDRLAGFQISGASDFKLMSRRAVDAWRKMEEKNLFFRGMSAWLGFKREQIEFSVPRRIGGKSSWSRLRLLKLALHALSAFSAIPLQLITLFGLLFLILSVALTADYLYDKFHGIVVGNFTTVVILISIMGSMLMISLGIIGQYIGNIYEEVKRRPRYIVENDIGGKLRYSNDGETPISL